MLQGTSNNIPKEKPCLLPALHATQSVIRPALPAKLHPPHVVIVGVVVVVAAAAVRLCVLLDDDGEAGVVGSARVPAESVSAVGDVLQEVGGAVVGSPRPRPRAGGNATRPDHVPTAVGILKITVWEVILGLLSRGQEVSA